MFTGFIIFILWIFHQYYKQILINERYAATLSTVANEIIQTTTKKTTTVKT